ncbi:MAG: SulP family inorganic anion transporter [Ruminococcaceae bacterium]|nr:SulP family inorganic anion transporter [Oscillospiraceae bacterium]
MNGKRKGTAPATKRPKASRLLAGLLPVSRGTLPRNILAGVTLAAAAIPIDMGYTKIAGLPVVSGLYILLLPTVAFALFGASRHLVVGADSASAAILAAGVLPLAAAGSTGYAGYAALLTLMVGLLLLVCRLFRLGFISNFLSRTVLAGFLAGIGVQVAISQLGDISGIPNLTGSSLQKLAGFFTRLGAVQPPTLLLAALAFALVFIPRLFYKKAPVLRRVPFSLVAIIGGMLAGMLAPAGTFETVGTVQGGLPGLTLPAFSLEAVNALLGPCIAIAVVIITQSAATTGVYATRYEEPVDTNRDILGLAAANLAAAFTGAFVANGSPTKTEIADEAGASSQVANLVLAGIVLVVLLFFTGPLQYIPTAVLAAIVLSASLGLVDLRGLRRIFAFSRAEFFVAIATALVVVLVGAAQGILFAMVLSLLVHVRKSYRPHNRVLAAGPNGREWRAAADGGQARPGVVVYRFASALYYANTAQFTAEVHALVAQNPGLRELALDGSAISSVDYSGCETLLETARMLQEKGIRLVVALLAKDTLAALTRCGFVGLIGQGNVYPTLRDYLKTHGNFEALLQ